MSSTAHIELAIVRSGLIVPDHVHDIVSAFNHVGAHTREGFDLAAVLSMVQDESAGRMVWGADPWNPGEYPLGLALPSSLEEHDVTEADYHAYRLERNRGKQPQGCGITQLTYGPLQIQAERAGGCWVPFWNCVIGFQFLLSLFLAHGGAFGGFEAYNGTGPAAVGYAEEAVARAARWQTILNHA